MAKITLLISGPHKQISLKRDLQIIIKIKNKISFYLLISG